MASRRISLHDCIFIPSRSLRLSLKRRPVEYSTSTVNAAMRCGCLEARVYCPHCCSHPTEVIQSHRIQPSYTPSQTRSEVGTSKMGITPIVLPPVHTIIPPADSHDCHGHTIARHPEVSEEALALPLLVVAQPPARTLPPRLVAIPSPRIQTRWALQPGTIDPAKAYIAHAPVHLVRIPRNGVITTSFVSQVPLAEAHAVGLTTFRTNATFTGTSFETFVTQTSPTPPFTFALI